MNNKLIFMLFFLFGSFGIVCVSSNKPCTVFIDAVFVYIHLHSITCVGACPASPFRARTTLAACPPQKRPWNARYFN